ncbi:hypothetical protein PSPO01_14740 [Paraphaeosphaeria sporulosa]
MIHIYRCGEFTFSHNMWDAGYPTKYRLQTLATGKTLSEQTITSIAVSEVLPGSQTRFPGLGFLESPSSGALHTHAHQKSREVACTRYQARPSQEAATSARRPDMRKKHFEAHCALCVYYESKPSPSWRRNATLPYPVGVWERLERGFPLAKSSYCLAAV